MKNFIKINRALAAKKTKIFTLFLALFASTTLIAQTSGYCGYHLLWAFDPQTNELHITGYGDMLDGSPWYQWRANIKSVTFTYSNVVKAEDMYIKCAGNGWNWEMMEKDGPNSYSYLSTVTDENIIGANINIIGSDGGSRWFDLGYGHHGFVPGDQIKYVFTGENPDVGTLEVFHAEKTPAKSKKTYSESMDVSGITSIGAGAFCGCTGLTSIEIPNSVTSIGNYAFEGCTGLTSVTIPNSVTSISEGVFNDCSSLTSVTIPNSVTSIGSYAFKNCFALTSVTIPNSVTSIGTWAFRDCFALTSITVPNSVTSIGADAFYNVFNIIYRGTATAGSPWGAKSMNGFVDGWLVYNDNTKTTLLVCSNAALGEIVIPNSVTSIGEAAFYDCSGLTSVTIGNSVTSIGNNAFSGCSGLTSVTIHSNAIVSKDYSSGGYSIKNIFGNQVRNYIIGSSVTSIGNYAFSECTGLTSVIIGNNVTNIGTGAFLGCTDLTSIEIPNSVTSIGDGAFYGCIGLPVIDNIRYADTYLVDVVDRTLSTYTIIEGTKYISNSSFQNCSSLTSITIPNSVTSIGENAFYSCSSLTDIYATCDDLDRVKQMLKNDSRVKYKPLPYSIAVYTTNGTVRYPQNSCDELELAATPDYGYHFVQWNDGVTDNPRIIELTQDTTFTAEFAIDKSGSCGKDNALIWSYDDQSKTLTITGNGELTENYTFGLEAPTRMITLIIGDGITAIGDSAFYNTKTLNHLFICGNVESVGNYAFAECKNFDDITCYATIVPTINATTFENVGNKQYIYLYVPKDRERAYKRDEFWGEFDIQIKSAETTTSDGDVTVVPTDNTAEISWPTVNDAYAYEIEITKDGEVFCVLKFNANGQLVGIAFVPGRNGANHTQQAQTEGFKFTVTGLTSGTQYGYSINSKDEGDAIIDSKTGTFTTTVEGESVNPTVGLEDVLSTEKARKIRMNDQIFILRGDKIYTVTGQEVR
ncbi:MAG: leucine-rich repeat protein [Paludibacteraceae bacterium]|nr:leucine-rich repeat protein [Paludibacteraceae bacterium]